jgi:hypothetical protein
MGAGKKVLPNGPFIETKEIWLSDKIKPIERRIVRDNLEFIAVINDFRIILPTNDYLCYLSVPDLQDYPKNHFEMGLWGWVGYWVNKNNQMIDNCALLGQRLAHLHYLYKQRPIFVDIGEYQYTQLSKQLNIKVIPKDCRPESLFNSMKSNLIALSEEYLWV